MSKKKITRVPIKAIVSEDGAHELASSEAMQPYLELLKAEIQGHDITPQVEEIAALPLEKRYIWRIASALSGASPTSILFTSPWTGKLFQRICGR
jgi:hypothetical protein